MVTVSGCVIFLFMGVLSWLGFACARWAAYEQIVFLAGSSLEIELGGLLPGSEYDQLLADTVTLAPSVPRQRRKIRMQRRLHIRVQKRSPFYI